ncbi:MAG: glutamate formimidoyltransferase, partial [Prevotella sp.]
MPKNQIIECVPNFSEGRDMTVIKLITDAIESVDGIKLLNVDPGEATNRTVVTFVGHPEAVVEAAFRGAKKAGEVIDMRRHHGAHPRMGATDVLPLIPVSGITLQECAILAQQLAERMAREAGIPCYAYEASALRPER